MWRTIRVRRPEDDQDDRRRRLHGLVHRGLHARGARTLRAKERIPALRQRNTLYDGRYKVPTFQEVIDLSRRLSKELGRPIGIYPETKHPTYFRSIGLALEEPLVRTLAPQRPRRKQAKVFVQSFEVDEPQGARPPDRHADRAAHCPSRAAADDFVVARPAHVR